MSIYFTSDLHLGHTNVLRFDNRPFSTIEEHDEELIKRWNAKVQPGDLVYVLGDMIWKTKADNAVDILSSLNGQKILIKGNHDKFAKNGKAKKCLAGIKDYDDISVTLKDGTVKRCVLSHYPIHFYVGHHYGAIMLFGHVHNSKEYELVTNYAKWLNNNGVLVEMYNVGTMLWGFEPVTLDEILEREKKGEFL